MLSTLFLQSTGKFRGCAVISCNLIAQRKEIALESGHTYAPGSGKIYLFLIHQELSQF